jgi:tRNA(Ile)-lysidine synthase
MSRTQEATRFTREWNAVKTLRRPTDKIWDGRWQLEGPHEDGLEIAALGEDGLQHCPDWRDTGLPRPSLLSSPAIWEGSALIAAPLAGLSNGWTATLAQPFLHFLANRARVE